MNDAYDTLFVGARVIDPETGLDDVRNVATSGDTIAYVGHDIPPASVVRDVAGLVLAPGFVDLHSHAQSPSGLRLQALDGVTTALDLEGGGCGVERLWAEHRDEGRPINFGYSAAWMLLRGNVMDGTDDPGATLAIDRWNPHASRWQEPATEAELDGLLDLVDAELDAGAIGVGVPIGYAPDVARTEYYRIAQVAERRRSVVFTHARYASVVEPGTSLDAALEIIAAAAGTGAAMHHCHINSTSLRQLDDVTAAIERARSRGNRVTTEAYPYGSGSTSIGAAFLAPEQLHRMGLTPSALRYLPTGERVASEARLVELRRDDPQGLCIVDLLDEDDPADAELLIQAVSFDDTAIASDAVPVLTSGGDRAADSWPLEPGAVTHPRTAGCFSRRCVPTAAARSGRLSLRGTPETAPRKSCGRQVRAGRDRPLPTRRLLVATGSGACHSACQ